MSAIVSGTMIVSLLAQSFAAQIEQNPENEKQQTGWQRLFKELADNFEIAPRDDPQHILPRRPQPLLHWNQPVRGGDAGATYIWHDQGRPAVIASFFAWPHPDGYRVVATETHSLSLTPLIGKWKSRPLWTPSKSGIQFKPVPGAPTPASKAAQRLAQMRLLAKQFQAKSTDHEDGEWQLRLLPRPLYRYELDDPEELLDGALFTFVQGTDPEAILLIEARKQKTGYQWQFACARFSDYRLSVKHQDSEVWNVPRAHYGNKQGTYLVLSIEKRKNPDDPQGEPIDVE